MKKIKIVVNYLRRFTWKCIFGHVWTFENLTDKRGRTMRMQRRCNICKQRNLLTIRTNRKGSQSFFWYKK